jgi:hypothetical protein
MNLRGVWNEPDSLPPKCGKDLVGLRKIMALLEK